jgi:glutamate transport system permease protein
MSLVLGGGLVAVLVWTVTRLAGQGLFESRRWDVFADAVTWEGLLRGLVATLYAAGLGAVGALGVGLVVAVGRISPRPWLRRGTTAVIEVLRGTPVVLLILFTLLVVGTSPLMAVVCGLTLYNGVVIAEILRAGIQALPRGQREAALALGLSPLASLRLVELPQAVRAMLPALVSQLVVLLKDTSLGFIVSYPELLRQIRTLTEYFGNRYLFSVFLVGTALYVTVNAVLSRLAAHLERRSSRWLRPLESRRIDRTVDRGR